MGRCPEQPPQKKKKMLSPVISWVLGYALGIHRTLMFAETVALLQGPRTTSSDALAFPVCLVFHTMAWREV